MRKFSALNSWKYFKPENLVYGKTLYYEAPLFRFYLLITLMKHSISAIICLKITLESISWSNSFKSKSKTNSPHLNVVHWIPPQFQRFPNRAREAEVFAWLVLVLVFKKKICKLKFQIFIMENIPGTYYIRYPCAHYLDLITINFLSFLCKITLNCVFYF